jgi:hypothetical protein
MHYKSFSIRKRRRNMRAFIYLLVVIGAALAGTASAIDAVGDIAWNSEGELVITFGITDGDITTGVVGAGNIPFSDDLSAGQTGVTYVGDSLASTAAIDASGDIAAIGTAVNDGVMLTNQEATANDDSSFLGWEDEASAMLLPMTIFEGDEAAVAGVAVTDAGDVAGTGVFADDAEIGAMLGSVEASHGETWWGLAGGSEADSQVGILSTNNDIFAASVAEGAYGSYDAAADSLATGGSPWMGVAAAEAGSGWLFWWTTDFADANAEVDF